MKRWGFMAVMVLGLALIGAGCGQTASDTGSSSTESESTTTNNAVKETATESDGTVQEISVTAKKFEFEPSTITVKMGQKVRLNIQSLDVDHGFSIPEFDVSETLKSGQTTVVEFTPDKKGKFTFSCSVFCGDGHPKMSGTFMVE